MHVVMGLGNPGPEYQGTRHNLGFEVVEQVARELQVTLEPRPGPSRVGTAEAAVGPVTLCCPETFMNRSGRALAALDPEQTWPSQQILVVYDELDLEAGDLRIRPRGSDGGHRGVRSIEEHLESTDFPRMRLGIGPRPADIDTIDFVLGRAQGEEREHQQNAVAAAAKAVLTWLDSVSLEIVMSRFNRRRQTEPDESDPA